MLQGYTLTGRTGLFLSYETFLGIIHTMMVQYAKFVKLGRNVSWYRPKGSLNYLATSTWAHQEQNGFSHQNPSFIGAVLNLKPEAARVYFPPDANCFLSTIAHCLRSKDYVNLMVGSKQPTPVWLSMEEADAASHMLCFTYDTLTTSQRSTALLARPSGSSHPSTVALTLTCTYSSL